MGRRGLGRHPSPLTLPLSSFSLPLFPPPLPLSISHFPPLLPSSPSSLHFLNRPLPSSSPHPSLPSSPSLPSLPSSSPLLLSPSFSPLLLSLSFSLLLPFTSLLSLPLPLINLPLSHSLSKAELEKHPSTTESVPRKRTGSSAAPYRIPSSAGRRSVAQPARQRAILTQLLP